MGVGFIVWIRALASIAKKFSGWGRESKNRMLSSQDDFEWRGRGGCHCGVKEGQGSNSA